MSRVTGAGSTPGRNHSPATGLTSLASPGAMPEDVVRHRTIFFHASDANDGDRLGGPVAARSRRVSAWSDDDAMRRAGIVGTRLRSQGTVLRTASAMRLPPDVRRALRYGPDFPCARLRPAVGLDPGVMVGKGELRRSCAALQRSRPADRRAYPCLPRTPIRPCLRHNQAAHAGRLISTAQPATASGPSSPANTHTATVRTPRAVPANHAMRR